MNPTCMSGSRAERGDEATDAVPEPTDGVGSAFECVGTARSLATHPARAAAGEGGR